MSNSYHFGFQYRGDDKRTNIGHKSDVKVNAFSVLGGASRSIYIGSNDDLSIGSEFEQARQYKNIVLFIPASSDHQSVKVAMDLMSFATSKMEIVFSFEVAKSYKGSLVYRLTLIDWAAMVRSEPTIVLGNMLMAEFVLPAPDLRQGKTVEGKYESEGI